MAGVSLVAPQVVIVGAGPVGLLLAGELRLGGAEVVVLERRPGPITESRASTLHARTMEVLDSRDLLPALGRLPRQEVGHFGGLPLDLTVPGPFPGIWKSPQPHTEAVLGRWAAGLGADLRFGHDVREFVAGPDDVQVVADGPDGTLRLSAAYLVGCDGDDSLVRLRGGFGFPGRPASRYLLRADVAGIDIRPRRFERLPRGLAIAAPGPDGMTRVMVYEYGSAAVQASFEELCARWLSVTGEDISHGEPTWVNAFDDGCRQVDHYRRGRVLLAGDAAHRQMPINGLALNLGLLDAVNLGWKLALDVTGRAHPDLLDTYHSERHRAGRQVLDSIEAQAELLFGDSGALAEVMSELMTFEPVRRHLASTVSSTALRYDVAGDPHPLLGSRLVHGQPVRPGRGALIDLYDDPAHHEAMRAAMAGWADRVDLLAVRPGPQGPLPTADAVLLRPDGHVVWVASAGAPGPAPLLAALRRWFGEPTPAESPSTSRPATTPATVHPIERRNEMNALTDRTALVTGSSRGIGRAIARRLAEQGALVAVHCGSRRDAAEEVVESIEKDGGRAFVVVADLGAPSGVHELFLGLEAGLKERVGSTRLDILVNNAAVMGGVGVADATPEQVDHLFAINAKAPFFIIQRALGLMERGGRVVNISSGLTRFANPDELPYAMTKGAVEQLALHLAKLLGPRGITVNSVAPGITRNGNPLFDIPEAVEQMAQLSAFGRVGEPEDVADVVAFLASDEARWVTGAFIDATGGTLLG